MSGGDLSRQSRCFFPLSRLRGEGGEQRSCEPGEGLELTHAKNLRTNMTDAERRFGIGYALIASVGTNSSDKSPSAHTLSTLLASGKNWSDRS